MPTASSPAIQAPPTGKWFFELDQSKDNNVTLCEKLLNEILENVGIIYFPVYVFGSKVWMSRS